MPPVSKIKVAFYCFFPRGGIGQYTHELLTQLMCLESLTVSLYCPPNFEWLNKAKYETHPVLFQISSNQPLIRKMKFLMGQWLNPNRFLHHAVKSKAHIVHFSNFNHLTYPAWKGFKTKNAPLVQACTAHDVKRAVPILNRNWETRQLRQFYKDCRIIFVHGENQKQELESFTGKGNYKTVIVPMGPYEFPGSQHSQKTKFEKKDNQASKGLFFGNIRDEKNLDGLLKALSLDPENVQLTVAGKSGISGHKSIQYYQNLADSLGLKGKILWRDGHVPEDQVSELFQSSDWVALPYKDKFTSQSGVFNIATHYSKPMLITPAPTFKEIFAKYSLGELAINEGPGEMQKALKRLIQGIKTSKYDGFQSYQDYHTWEKNAEFTQSAYQESMDPRVESV